MTAGGSFEIDTAYLTDKGCVRDENQDACAKFVGPHGEQLLIVADGMGGHQGGATASRLLIDTTRARAERSDSWNGDLLRDTIIDANARIHLASTEQLSMAGMGTTVVAVVFGGAGSSAWVAHVGDSRAYLLRRGNLTPLTEDHSAVVELLRHGAITEEEAHDHPRRNEIVRSVGVAPDVEVDVTHFQVDRGDRILLCSDGLCGVLRDEEIAGVLDSAPPDEAVSKLVAAAKARGGPDNVTVMVSALSTETNADPRTQATSQASNRGRTVFATAVLITAIAVLLLLLARQCAPLPKDSVAASEAPIADVGASPTPAIDDEPSGDEPPQEAEP